MIADNDLTVIPIRELVESKRTTSLIHANTESLSPAVRLWIDEIATHYKRGGGGGAVRTLR